MRLCERGFRILSIASIYIQHSLYHRMTQEGVGHIFRPQKNQILKGLMTNTESKGGTERPVVEVALPTGHVTVTCWQKHYIS